MASVDRTDSRFWAGQDEAERDLRGCIITNSVATVLFFFSTLGAAMIPVPKVSAPAVRAGFGVASYDE